MDNPTRPLSMESRLITANNAANRIAKFPTNSRRTASHLKKATIKNDDNNISQARVICEIFVILCNGIWYRYRYRLMTWYLVSFGTMVFVIGSVDTVSVDTMPYGICTIIFFIRVILN